MGETSNERSVKVAKAQKGSDVLDFGGCGPVFDACNFCGVHACYPLFKDYPQVIYGWGMERALFGLEIEVVILCDCENIFNSFDMIFEGSGRSDSDIVHVNSNGCSPYCVFCDDIFIDLIHHGLEGCRRVTKAKEHDCGLEESISCFKGRFVFVSLLDAYVIVSPPDIELGKY